MAGKFSNRSNFDIPAELIDEHEWVSDEFIDGPFGKDCLLEFHPIDSECPNCYFDPETRRSSNIYKTGGPISFANHTTCPHCGGRGREVIAPETEEIRLRVYWKSNKWVQGGNPPIGMAEAECRIIGYMCDLPKLERARSILVQSKQDATKHWRCERDGEARPHGFRGDRYFQQSLKRSGGG